MNGKDTLFRVATKGELMSAINLRINKTYLLASALHASPTDIAMGIAFCEDISGKELCDEALKRILAEEKAKK